MNWLAQKTKPKEQSRDPHEKPVIDTGIPSSKENIPFFSVCIPTYNRADLLATAIESVLSQDFDDFELIICDNASTDNTEAVVRSYQDRRIRYVRYENLVSMYANHNRCVNIAQSEWIIFLHSDDFLYKNALSQIKNYVTSGSELDLLSPSIDHLEEYRKSIATNSNILRQKEAIFSLLTIDGFSPNGSAFKKKSFQKYGYFNESSLLADGQLEILWLLNSAKLKIAQESWTSHQQSSQSSFHKLSQTSAYHKAHFPLFEIFFSREKYEKDLKELSIFLQKMPSNLQARFLRRCYQAGYKKEANKVESFLKRSTIEYQKEADYKNHVKLLQYFPKIYWLILDLVKIFKFKFKSIN